MAKDNTKNRDYETMDREELLQRAGVADDEGLTRMDLIIMAREADRNRDMS